MNPPEIEPDSTRGSEGPEGQERPDGSGGPAGPGGEGWGEASGQGGSTSSPRALDSRDKILEVAEALFARSGFAGVGMRQLATSVGLGKSSLFHHFPTKLDLYAEVLDRVLERVEAGLDGAAGATAAPLDRLDAWIRSVVGSLAEDAHAARLMMRALVEDEPFAPFVLEPGSRELLPFDERLIRIIDRFRSLLEEGVASGVFRPVSIGDAIQSVIGTLVFHFASGDLGEAMIGEPIFSGSAVDRRRREVSEFIRRGLLA